MAGKGVLKFIEHFYLKNYLKANITNVRSRLECGYNVNSILIKSHETFPTVNQLAQPGDVHVM